MPSGNLTQVERLKKMVQVRDLVDEGLSNSAIAKKIGIEVHSVKRMKLYIDELALSELTSKEISNKRAELYLEITDAAIEAKKLFDKFKGWINCGMCGGKGILTVQKKDSEITKPCLHCKGLGGFIRTNDAKKFFDAWMDSIDRRMRLYGLDNIKGGDVILNQQINANHYVAPDTIDVTTADRISKLIKNDHESNIRDKYESNREY